MSGNRQSAADELRKCREKDSFETAAKARKRAEALRRSFGGPRLRAYECPWCGEWHLTKKAKRDD